MSDPVSQELFFATIDQLRKEADDRHQRLRQAISDGFHDLTKKLEEHSKEARSVADRVLTMETQRTEEKAQAVRRGTWAGLAAASGVSLLFEIWRRLSGPG